MSKKRTRDKIISNTANKVIVKIHEVGKALDDNEVAELNALLDKIR